MDGSGVSEKGRDDLREDVARVLRPGSIRQHADCVQNYSGGGISGTLDASYYKGTGTRNGKEREFVAIEKDSVTTSSGDDSAKTLDASYFKGAGARGNQEREFVAVCIGNGQADALKESSLSGALDCMHDQKAVVYPGVGITSPENGNNPQPGSPSPTLTDDSRNYLVQKKRKYIVRRLTPLECCRLQGFPDWWTDGADGSDSAVYKMWGNGVALPCVEDVLGRIADAARGEHT